MSKILDEYKEAYELGIETKVVITGPFTFLKLLKYTGTKKFEDYLLKIQKEEEINGINSTIMKFNLAKINILEKNVKLAAEKIIEINLNEIANLKQNYIKF